MKWHRMRASTGGIFFSTFLPLFLGCISAGCGGGSAQAPAQPLLPAATGATAAPAYAGAAALPLPRATSRTAPAQSTITGAGLFRRFRALPLIRLLNEHEQSELFARLEPATAARRIVLINGYARLGELPDIQKDILLAQLEELVPVRSESIALLCTCGAGIERPVCARESCADDPTLAALCTRACGALPAYRHTCRPSAACAAR
jgi:hypothetical protein